MGIIEKQATKNTIFSYSGSILGFLTVLFMAKVLRPDENGLISLLLSISLLMSQVSALGFNNITLRYFPYFRNKEKGHHGFLFYGLVITTIGFLLCVIGYLVFEEYLIEVNKKKSTLFVDYMVYILPLTLFMLFFNLFDYYLRSIFSSVIGVSSKDVIQRILILAILSIYYFHLITFETFVFTYTISVAIPTLILLFYILKLREWHVKPVGGVVSPEMRKEMVKLSLYSLFVGGGGVFLANIDIIMVNQLLGLSKTGIYSIAFYFGTIIIIPSRALIRIAISIISEAFKKDDLTEIATIYRKSCNSQLTIALLLFILLWSNIENVILLLPEAYRGGKYVILYIAAGYVFDMATGVNYVIIITSKYFRYDGYFMVFILLLAIASNYILIPIMGVEGAALATAITITTYNLLRWWFVYHKFKMQPFNFNTVKLVVIGFITAGIGYLLPHFQHFMVDILLRSIIVGGCFSFLFLFTNASPEINAKIRKNLKHLPFSKGG